MPFSGRHLAGKQSKTTFAINAATTYFCHFEVRIAKSYLWYVRAQLNTLKEETLIHLFIFLIRSICLFVCFCFCFFFHFLLLIANQSLKKMRIFNKNAQLRVGRMFALIIF